LASTADLDRWRQSATATPEDEASAPASPNRRLWLAIPAVFAVALLAWFALRPSPVPASIRVAGSGFVALDKFGHELWAQTHTSRLSTQSYVDRTLSHVGDLDGDGTPEVLFALASHDSAVVCYDNRGKVRWTFVPGAAVRTSETRFERAFGVFNLFVDTFAPGEPPSIIVVSGHHTFYPSQVARLDSRGQVQAEYWHSGHLQTTAGVDTDGDGRKELLLTGINNAWNQAILLALDVRHMNGAGPEPEHPRHQLLDRPLAQEKARILLPRTSCNRELHPFNVGGMLRSGPDGIELHTVETESPGSSMIWSFDRGLRLKGLSASSALHKIHEEMRQQGKIDQRLDVELEELKRQVRYLKPL
jgi:hypothetical protein